MNYAIDNIIEGSQELSSDYLIITYMYLFKKKCNAVDQHKWTLARIDTEKNIKQNGLTR